VRTNQRMRRYRRGRGKKDRSGKPTESKNPIFSQELVSIKYGCGGPWEIHHFSVEISCEWTCSICVVRDCCIAVSTCQLRLVTESITRRRAGFEGGEKLGEQGLTQRRLLVELRSSQRPIQMAIISCCSYGLGPLSSITLSRMFDIYSSAYLM
jgi:hypothetical protein